MKAALTIFVFPFLASQAFGSWLLHHSSGEVVTGGKVQLFEAEQKKCW